MFRTIRRPFTGAGGSGGVKGGGRWILPGERWGQLWISPGEGLGLGQLDLAGSNKGGGSWILPGER